MCLTVTAKVELTKRYDTVDLRALKSWRGGQLNLSHWTETKNKEKLKTKTRVAQKNGLDNSPWRQSASPSHPQRLLTTIIVLSSTFRLSRTDDTLKHHRGFFTRVLFIVLTIVACYYHIRQLRCIWPCIDLIRQLPVPLLPLSFTPNLITVILST